MGTAISGMESLAKMRSLVVVFALVLFCTQAFAKSVPQVAVYEGNQSAVTVSVEEISPPDLNGTGVGPNLFPTYNPGPQLTSNETEDDEEPIPVISIPNGNETLVSPPPGDYGNDTLIPLPGGNNGTDGGHLPPWGPPPGRPFPPFPRPTKDLPYLVSGYMKIIGSTLTSVGSAMIDAGRRIHELLANWRER
ncbi:unnamed protein product [Echinostoma caproni]|uniref:Leguminosin group485 secreted peptide n=1 Tax=Echinostoma caproni TaxID=27848 RepID=A0A183A6B4_9TREM|nr:unnamed protein product [Echinostoma caproni]